MKFVLGEPPKNRDFDFTGFEKLDEPPKAVFMKAALLLQTALWIIFLLAWLLLDPDFIQDLGGMGIIDILLAFPLAFFIAIVIHEIIHALVYPLDKYRQITFGCWPEMGALYASFHGKLSRNRWLLVYGMPFLCISIIPLVLSGSGIPTWAKIASILNAGFSAGDLFAMYLIARQIPGSAMMVQDGWDTYWRSAEQ